MRRRLGGDAGLGDRSIDDAAGRRQRRITIGVLVLLLVSGTAVGLGAGLLHDDHARPAHRRSTVGLIIGLAVPVLLALAAVCWVSWLYRRPAYRELMQYSWRRRNRVAKALRKGQRIAEEDLPVASAVVAMQRRQWWLPWLFAAAGAFWLVHGLLSYPGTARWFWVCSGVVYLVYVVPVFVVQRRKTISGYVRARGQHPSPDDGRGRSPQC